jgi:hypothetical protein
LTVRSAARLTVGLLLRHRPELAEWTEPDSALRRYSGLLSGHAWLL